MHWFTHLFPLLVVLIGLALAAPLHAQEPAPAPAPADGLRHLALAFDFAPYLGTSSIDGTRTVRSVSLGMLGALTGGVEGFGLGFLAHITVLDLHGLQAAGLASYVGGSARGLNLAGLGAWQDEGLRGASLAGLGSVTVGPVSGVQAAGLVVAAQGEVHGVQAAGISAVATGQVEGLQAAGVFNYAKGVTGAQLGTVNVSSQPVTGVQLGLINVAPESDASLGLLNVIWRGRTHLSAWADETGTAHLTIKHGGRYLHNLYDVAYRLSGSEYALQLGLGLGGHFPLAARLSADVDLLGAWVFTSGSGSNKQTNLWRLSAMLGWQALPRLAFFGGPSVVAFLSNIRDGGGLPPFSDLLVRDGAKEDYWMRVWPGLVVGVQGL
jgi:hypothetical protein